MCTTCGCGRSEAAIERGPRGGAARYRATHKPATLIAAIHGHADAGEHANPDVPGSRLGAVHATGTPAERIVAIERDLLAANDAVASANRHAFLRHGIFALNLVSSPGAGKTTLLERTLDALKARWPLAVIEGDQASARDADRIRATGVPAIQINTGKGCHLDARMVADALPRIGAQHGSILFIENVGNLVCPAAFDLGEAHKVVVLSVTEGDDKPLKYPDMFRAAGLIVLSKIDLLPYVTFDVAATIARARRLNPRVGVIQLSATTGQGMDAWLDWLEDRLRRVRADAVALAGCVDDAR